MPTLLPLEDYVAEVLASLRTLPSREVALAQAHGLVLARDVVAVLPVPPWTNSAMDGYAVRHREIQGACPERPVTLTVSGDVPAGCEPEPLTPGTAVRIMTGAMLPQGADTIIKVEDTDQAPGPHPLPQRVEVRSCPPRATSVRLAGEDVAEGDPVLAAGTVLSAAALSALASVGLGTVLAVPAVRVAVVSTGSELVEPGQALAPGTIPDSNSLLLAGLVREHGAVLSAVLHAQDSASSLRQALVQAAQDADLVITSGGVSAGAFDPLTMLAQDTSSQQVRLSFAKVAMQPGKPQGHGSVLADDGREVPLLMLPGNPVSVLVSFATIVAPALARLSGHDAGLSLGPALSAEALHPDEALPLRARAAVSWRGAGKRRQHVPVRLVGPPAHLTEGTDLSEHDLYTPWIAPTHHLGSGSHLVASLPGAQALAVVEAGTPGVEVGDEVTLIALSQPAAPVQPSQAASYPPLLH